MKLNLNRGSREDGVALVITLIMLAVVTFLAVAYLAMSRRERSSIGTAEQQNRAKLMAEAGFEHLKGKVISNILTYTNAGSYDLVLSTNFNNPERRDFDSGAKYVANSADVRYLTNVCMYDTNGTPIPWSEANLTVNLGNLQISPVVPVFYDVVTNHTHSNDFRFYLDFNRNGKFDPTRSTNDSTAAKVYTTHWGDPQWVGVLQDPSKPHSPENRFVGRFAYIGVPVGKTLDINYIHNNLRKNTLELKQNAYQRAQGLGSWELNLAAFFRELNPLQWEDDDYIYYSNTNLYHRGGAFTNALEILSYRYNGDYGNLKPFSATNWIPRQIAYDNVGRLFYNDRTLKLDRNSEDTDGVLGRFKYDLADTYSDGPIQETAYRMGGSSSDWDDWDNEDVAHLDDEWVGSDNPRKLFDIQELVDDSKFSGNDLVARLQGTYSTESYTDEERYLTNDLAFYKLISQLSADSVSTANDRISLNYTTVASSGYTNFIPWTANTNLAGTFFRTTANRLLGKYLNQSITNIQIFPTNQYSAAVHQIFQLTANIYDTMTNRPTIGEGPALPTVFRPVYRVSDGRVYLADFELVLDRVDDCVNNCNFLRIVPRISGAGEIVLPNVTVATFADHADSDNIIRVNVIGMPWVIAARKGYPNFNEQELMTDVQLTRKIGLTRRNEGGIFNVKDMWLQYDLSISNRLAIEAWDSYTLDANKFPRPLNLRITNRVTMALWHKGEVVEVSTATNAYGVPTQYREYVERVLGTNIPSSSVPNWENQIFRTMNSSNLVFVPASIVETHQSGGAYYSTNSTGQVTLEPKNPSLFYKGADFLTSRYPLYAAVTNQITYIAIDTANDWVVDYVCIEKTNMFNITSLITGNNGVVGSDGSSMEQLLWSPTYGIQRQIEVSLGNVSDQNTWTEFAGKYNEKDYQIQGFRQFCGLTNTASSTYGLADTQGIYRQTPYNPTVHKLVVESLQANDPLVHYHVDDLVNYTNVYTPKRAAQANDSDVSYSNIGSINNFYVPWGGNPNTDITCYRESINVPGLKDPNVGTSDNWDFPTNWYGRPFSYPTLGWLGKIHRGTPWQTVYLKSDAVADDVWTLWSGRSGSHPTNDWYLMDVFTTAINQNAARGLLSVNQTNSAAWAAVLGGVLALNGTNNGSIIAPQTSEFHQIVTNINHTRSQLTGGAFTYQGEVLSSPCLTVMSPYLGTKTNMVNLDPDVTDAVVEWLPMQIMSLLKEDKPAYLVYAYGQALEPAPGAIILAPGDYRGMVTNYVVSAEYATKTLFRVENAPLNPKVVVESFDILPME